mmetsp:Transcript_14713/g.60095  ORF Transcript_14713/g.60095 Transcript_14713/m.60095 type:complete len:524 (+) Transcript_14713:151-1722(+)
MISIDPPRPRASSHGDLLLRQLREVLLRNPARGELLQLALLDRLQPGPLRREVGSHPVALLEVLSPVSAAHLLVVRNLRLELLLVLPAHGCELRRLVGVLLLLLHLHVDDPEELVSFLPGLVAELLHLEHLLVLSSDAKVLVDGALALSRGSLLLPVGPLVRLLDALGPELVHRRRRVGVFLLLRPQPSRLELLLPRHPLLLSLLPRFALVPLRDVPRDALLLLALALHHELLALQLRGVGLGNLREKLLASLLLAPALGFSLVLHALNLGEHQLPVHVEELILELSLLRPLRDLLLENLGAPASVRGSLLLASLVEVERLEPLNLHHDVQPALLLCRLRLDVLLLLELRVPDGDALAVEHHLVHVLDLVELLVEERLRARLGHLRPHRLESLALGARVGGGVAGGLGGEHALLARLGSLGLRVASGATRALDLLDLLGAEHRRGLSHPLERRAGQREGRAGAAEGRPGAGGCHRVGDLLHRVRARRARRAGLVVSEQRLVDGARFGNAPVRGPGHARRHLYV